MPNIWHADASAWLVPHCQWRLIRAIGLNPVGCSRTITTKFHFAKCVGAQTKSSQPQGRQVAREWRELRVPCCPIQCCDASPARKPKKPETVLRGWIRHCTPLLSLPNLTSSGFVPTFVVHPTPWHSFPSRKDHLTYCRAELRKFLDIITSLCLPGPADSLTAG